METFRTKEKIKDLYVYLNDRMKSWPQYEKYALSEYCRCKLLHMIELCVAINKSSKAKAKVYELDNCLQELRDYMDVAQRAHYLSEKQFLVASKRISEVGGMIGNLIKTLPPNLNRHTPKYFGCVGGRLIMPRAARAQLWRQLEQRCTRWFPRCQCEQLPVERQHERGRLGRL